MIFYFVCYLIVGIGFGICGTLQLAREDYRASQLSLFWLRESRSTNAIKIFATFASPLLAVITSLIQGGLWVLATIAELYLGMILARFLIPLPLMNILGLFVPIANIIIFGALWGFWWL